MRQLSLPDPTVSRRRKRIDCKLKIGKRGDLAGDSAKIPHNGYCRRAAECEACQ
jgi:hypothetical protein